MQQQVHLLNEERFDPPRRVEIEHDDRWLPGVRHSWRLCSDGRGWTAEICWSEKRDWGHASYNLFVLAERVRLPDSA